MTAVPSQGPDTDPVTRAASAAVVVSGARQAARLARVHAATSTLSLAGTGTATRCHALPLYYS